MVGELLVNSLVLKGPRKKTKSKKAKPRKIKARKSAVRTKTKKMPKIKRPAPKRKIKQPKLIKNISKKTTKLARKQKLLSLAGKRQDKALKKESVVKVDASSFKKEIKQLTLRLRSGIKAIDKHESILKNKIEQNLRYTTSELDSIKKELKEDAKVKEELAELRETIKIYRPHAKDDKSRKQLQNFISLYKGYSTKAKGIRKAIMAKIEHLKEINRQIDDEESREAEMEQEKKNILEVERILKRRRFFRKVKRFFVHDEHTKKYLAKRAEIAARERQDMIKKDDKARQLQIKGEDRELAKQYDAEQEQNKKRFAEKLFATEKKRNLEKQKLLRGRLYIPLFKPKKLKADEKEIRDAIESLKVVANPGVEVNDVEYVTQRIIDAKEALLEFDILRARKLYLEIIKLYNNLSNKNKSRLYEDIKNLYEERKGAEMVVSHRA